MTALLPVLIVVYIGIFIELYPIFCQFNFGESFSTYKFEKTTQGVKNLTTCWNIWLKKNQSKMFENLSSIFSWNIAKSFGKLGVLRSANTSKIWQIKVSAKYIEKTGVDKLKCVKTSHFCKCLGRLERVASLLRFGFWTPPNSENNFLELSLVLWPVVWNPF